MSGPTSITATWAAPLHLDGVEMDGYKVAYWSKPTNRKIVELPPDVSGLMVIFNGVIYKEYKRSNKSVFRATMEMLKRRLFTSILI